MEDNNKIAMDVLLLTQKVSPLYHKDPMALHRVILHNYSDEKVGRMKGSMIKLLRENGAPIDLSKSGDYLCHIVMEYPRVFMTERSDYREFIQFLLQQPNMDIPINSQDCLGRTPLHNAILYRGDEDLVALLLQCPGININIQDNDGRTPLI